MLSNSGSRRTAAQDAAVLGALGENPRGGDSVMISKTLDDFEDLSLYPQSGHFSLLNGSSGQAR